MSSPRCGVADPPPTRCRRISARSLTLSRSVSNLGSSFGTAIAGTILVSDLASGNTSYVLAMVALAVLGLVGLAAALRLPPSRGQEHPMGEPDAAHRLGTATEHG